MITGVVTANHEATIPLVVHGAHGQQETIDAVIDTGFTGSVTLPHMLITALGLSWLGRQRVMLGDGSMRFFDVYAGTILWDGQVRTVEIDATDAEPLLGMHLLTGHEVRMQVVDGGTVTIEALP
jgi:clan AA aspartic protease